MAVSTAEKKQLENSKRTNNKRTVSISRCIVVILLILLLCYGFYIRIRAKNIGIELGMEAGKTAGRLMGSYDGITKGISEGKQEGTEVGLSAKDTEVDVGNKIQTIGKLEVLSASVTVHDYMGISDKYGTIFALYGDIVFTIDLYNAKISRDGNRVNVIISEPVPELILDQKKTEQLAVDMKYSWSGSNEEGYTATMNSFKELRNNIEKSVSNYDVLMESAKDSAIKQVSFLIQSATNEEVIPNVEFAEIQS